MIEIWYTQERVGGIIICKMMQEKIVGNSKLKFEHCSAVMVNMNGLYITIFIFYLNYSECITMKYNIPHIIMYIRFYIFGYVCV